MWKLPPTARPGGFSSHMPCATVFILDPYPGGAHGQGLLLEPELGRPPRDSPGPLCSHPSVGKSGHLVSAGPGRQEGKPVLAPELGLHMRDAPGHAYLPFRAI